jgi:RNA polymerase sigma factor (sigma-70 family)
MADAEFDELLLRARAGDESAMANIVERYEPEVRMVARARLGAALRPHLDSLDLVQSVHRSLIVGLRAERFDISTPENLIALAMTIVRRKVARHWRKLKRQQRLSHGGDSPDLPDVLGALNSTELDPARDVAVREAASQLVAQLDETERQVVELRLEGHTTAEVARQLNLDPDVLRVKLSRLRRRLRERGLLEEWL